MPQSIEALAGGKILEKGTGLVLSREGAEEFNGPLICSPSFQPLQPGEMVIVTHTPDGHQEASNSRLYRLRTVDGRETFSVGEEEEIFLRIESKR